MTIKEIRTACDLTQQALSDLTGIPKRTIENWESGSRNPPEWLPKMIACYLDNDSMRKTPLLASVIRETCPDASGREYIVNRCNKMYGNEKLNIYVTFKHDICGVGSIITSDLDILIRLLNADNVMTYDIFAQ